VITELENVEPFTSILIRRGDTDHELLSDDSIKLLFTSRSQGFEEDPASML
jgi:hypothetical protein